ncbi:MAG: hypothetical protein NTZ09_09025 [Candidatus Hydrogenedentes bacterium]|nr:hypothetical protein [Candidatus Hydrogenedentota bacterium]
MEMPDEIRDWNRVMAVLRDNLQGSEPFACLVEKPAGVDVAVSAGLPVGLIPDALRPAAPVGHNTA